MSKYGTAAGFRIYIAARGITATNSTDDTIVDAALLVASEWLDAKYRSQFPGLKVGGREQIREWPRTGVIDIYGYAVASDAVPTEVENAAYQVAVRELNTPGTLSLDFTPNKYRRASVSGAVSVEYNLFSASSEAQTQLQIVDEILSSILCSGETSTLSGSVGRA